MKPSWLIVGTVLLLIVAVVVATPPLARWALRSQLATFGFPDAAIGAVAINPFTIRVTVEDIDLDGDAAADPLRLGRMQLRLNLWSLTQGRIHVRELVLEDGGVRLEAASAGADQPALRIAGLTPNQWSSAFAGPDAAPTGTPGIEPASPPWTVSLDGVELREFTPHIVVDGNVLDLHLLAVRLGSLATDLPDRETSLDIEGELQQRPFRVSAALHPFDPATPGRLALPTALRLDLAPLVGVARSFGVELQPDSSLRLSGELSAAQTPAGPDLSWTGALTFETAGLHSAPVRFAGRAGWQGRLGLQPAATGDSLELSLAGEIELDAPELEMTLPPSGADADAAAAALSARAGRLTATVGASGDPVAPALTLDELDVSGLVLETSDNRVSLGELSLARSRVSPTAAVAFDDLRLRDVTALRRDAFHPGRTLAEVDDGLQRSETDPAPGPDLLRLASLQVESFRLDDDGTRTGAVTLEQPELFVWNGPDGARELAAATALMTDLAARFAPPATAVDTAALPTAADPGGPASTGAAVNVIGEVRVRNAIVIVEDHAARPAVRHPIRELNLTLGGYSDAPAAAPTTVTADARYAERGRIELRATLSPTDTLPEGPFEARVTAVPLQRISPYLERIGYRLLTGRLDTDISGRNDAGVIDAGVDLTIHNLEIDKLRPDETDEFTADLGLPLNTALSLLKDRRNDIHLDVPLQGTMDTIAAGYGDAIRKVLLRGTTRALKTGLALGFGPVGIAFLVGDALVGNARVGFDPIPFEPGSSALDPAAAGTIEKFGALLEERPGFRLKLCGVTTAADVAALTTPPDPPDATAPGIGVTAAGGAIGTPPDPLVLRALASDRAEAIAAALRPHVIDPDAQLFPCAPVVAPEDPEAPRVEMRL